MKNISKKLLLLVVLLVSVFAFTACGSKDNNGSGAAGKDSLIGTWEVSDSGVTIRFIFNEDKTGSFSLIAGDESDVDEFTYEYDDTVIKYTFKEDDETEEQETTYKFEDGKLILTDEGESYTLTRK